jgi:hypothetical protein
MPQMSAHIRCTASILASDFVCSAYRALSLMRRCQEDILPCPMAFWAVSVSPVMITVLAAVHVVDPRSLLIPYQGSGLSSVQLDLPQALLKSVPHFELGDADDPMSSWIFGKRAEIFQYKFEGGPLPAMVPCLSHCGCGLQM